MRQKNETATSFKELKEITQIMQARKRSAQTNANANASEITYQSVLTPKESAQTKKAALKPTKKAFSERQKTTLKNPQASANARLKTKQGGKQANKKGGNNEA